MTLNLLYRVRLLLGGGAALLGELALTADPIMPPSGPFDLKLPDINFEDFLRRGGCLHRLLLSEDLVQVFQKVVGACRLSLVISVWGWSTRLLHELRGLHETTEIQIILLRISVLPANLSRE